MRYTLNFTYMGCQTCHARVHCDECEAGLAEAMVRMQGIQGASVQMAVKELRVDADLDLDDLTDALEDLGIFAD